MDKKERFVKEIESEQETEDESYEFSDEDSEEIPPSSIARAKRLHARRKSSAESNWRVGVSKSKLVNKLIRHKPEKLMKPSPRTNNSNKNMVQIPFPDLDLLPGRPIVPTFQEHGFISDYDQSVYINPETLSIQRYHLTLGSEVSNSTSSFKIPHQDLETNSSTNESTNQSRDILDPKLKRLNNTDVERENRTVKWVKDNINKTIEYTEEEEIINSRMKDLMDIPPEDYLNVLYEIRYRRDQQRHRRHKKRKELLTNKQNVEVKREARKGREEVFKKWKTEWKQFGRYSLKGRCIILWHLFQRRIWKFYRSVLVYNWKKFGFNEPSSANVLHNFSCFNVLLWGTIGLIIQHNEVQELNAIFFGDDTAPVISRGLTCIALALLIISGICGLIGGYFKRGTVMLLYILLFVIGWTMFLANILRERHYAVHDGIQRFMMTQVRQYLDDPQDTSESFLKSVQTEFGCCGANGPKDYGYNGTVAPGGKFNLPQSCCSPKSSQYQSHHFTECYISKSVGFTKIPNFVSYDGCAKQVKQFLYHLYSFKTPVTALMIFATFTTIFSFININCHINLREFSQKKDKRQYTTGELFLHALEESTTTTNEFELESVPGTIDSIRKRLSDCETINDFVRIIVEIIREVEFIQDMDPVVLARVILGLRPRRYLPTELLDDQLEKEISMAPTVESSRVKLAQQDLYYRYIMQADDKPVREQLQIQKEKAKLYPKLVFPLPRPLSGVREARWEQLHGNIVRTDRYLKDENKHLSTTDPEWLEADRVIAKPEPRVKQSIWKQMTSKLSFSNNNEEEQYRFLEEEQFRPQIEVLTQIIIQAQAMLRELSRKTGFMDQLTGGRDQNQAEDEFKLNQAVKMLNDTQAIEEKRVHQRKPVLKSETSVIKAVPMYNKPRVRPVAIQNFEHPENDTKNHSRRKTKRYAGSGFIREEDSNNISGRVVTTTLTRHPRNNSNGFTTAEKIPIEIQTSRTNNTQTDIRKLH